MSAAEQFENFALVPEQGVVPEKEQLPPEMRARIEALAARLDARDAAAVSGFGAKAQKELGALSDLALTKMLDDDVRKLDGATAALGQWLTNCSFSRKAKGFLRRALGAAATLGEVRAEYERAEPHIDEIANELTDRRVALMRDGALLDRLYEKNEALYRELCSLLVVGEEAVRQSRARSDAPETTARLERRMQDLKVTQVASTQFAAQIRAVQASDKLTCEKLRAAVETTLPLWKAQMAAALGIARATDSLTAARRAGKEAARGVREGAREMEAQTRAFREAESGADDRERAEQTAEALLRELEEIEGSLKAREAGMKGEGTGSPA